MLTASNTDRADFQFCIVDDTQISDASFLIGVAEQSLNIAKHVQIVATAAMPKKGPSPRRNFPPRLGIPPLLLLCHHASISDRR